MKVTFEIAEPETEKDTAEDTKSSYEMVSF
jgi:hypothetical protein